MKSKGSFAVQTTAVVLNGPRDIRLDTLTVAAPQAKDLVVQIKHSGISTGTEKLFWSGLMPPFPGMGYPLVPGYEATGEVVARHHVDSSGIYTTPTVANGVLYAQSRDGDLEAITIPE